ncbi:MAG: S9 family peptidase [Chloroflexi bacterium]|nr:MAG: S9 family peptidase [Chloroflexota bacterium]
MAERLGTRITPAIVARYPRPGMSIPARIAYSPDGKAITYLASERGDLVFDLWRFELETGRTEVLIRAAETGREAELSLQERLRRERLRRREVGITEYWWAAEAPVMLVPIEGDLYRWEAGSLRRLTSGAITPQISRDGRLVFFVRDGEVRVLDQDGERALTSGAQPGVGNGSAEYVAQEELDRYSGFWVSRDSRWLAFEQVDERHVPVYPIVHQGQDRIEIEEHRYPFAGADNVRWRLGVTPVAGGGVRWLDLGDPEDHYLARVDWHPDGRLFIQRLRRDWRLLELLAFDPTTGRTSTLVSEQADPWINLHDDLRFDPRTGEFTWSSESGGFRRLSVHAPDGRLQRWLTWDDRPVDALLGLDALSRQVAFAAPSGSPLERHLYRVPLDGGAPVALTADGGTHHAVFAPDFSSLVEVFDSVRRPPAVVVRRLDGGRIAVLHEPERLDHDLRPPEFHSFESEEGVTLHAALYRPEGGTLPPILVSVYGGPATQTVQDTWALTVDMRAQMLAERGFLVIKIDNRGSARRGLRFEAAIAGRLGDREVTDQAAGVRWLASLGLGDASRVGIYGWSYGGYMTAMAMLKAPDLFQVGVAGAPVTSWDGYDTAYTEKYLGTPRDNPDGYREASALTHAHRLRGRLLLIHGLIDENVHFRHTARLMDALTKANRPYDLLIYPNERHMPRSERDREAMETRILAYFESLLAGASGPGP